MRGLSPVRTAAGAFVLAACGGITSVAPGGGDASVDGSGPGDAASQVDARDDGVDAGPVCFGFSCDASDEPVVFPACPATAPPVGSSCANEGDVCEYGPSWWLACNQVLRCTSGTWQVEGPYGPGPCWQLDAAGTCPATWAEASALDAATACPALDCQYPEGYCECVSGCGGGGQSRPHPMVTGVWECQAATPACPSPRPRLGTACEDADAGCQYGWPCGCGQQLGCSGGVWQGSSIPVCP